MACGYPASPPGKPRWSPTSRPAAPLLLQDREAVLVAPLPLEPRVLEQVRLVPHAEPPQDRGGADVARVEPGDDPVQVQVVERDAEQVPGTFSGEPAPLEVRVQHVADLAAAMLHAAEHQHELTDQPAGGVVEAGQGDPVAVD